MSTMACSEPTMHKIITKIHLNNSWLSNQWAEPAQIINHPIEHGHREAPTIYRKIRVLQSLKSSYDICTTLMNNKYNRNGFKTIGDH